MAKFSGRNQRTNPISRIRTDRSEHLVTHEGGSARAPDPETELFLTAATMMAGEGTFYESASERDARFIALVHQVTASNPDFVARFAPYLRNELKIRSASVMLAAEYSAAGGPGSRSVIDSVLQRPDEPAELVGYWLDRHGRRLRMPVKRGVADAATRLYTERAALRYDGASRSVRMGDVLELTHPRPRDHRQDALFRWLLDRRHRNDATADPATLPMLASAEALQRLPTDDRRAALRSRGADGLSNAGISWERLSGWLPGGMDAEAWESVIPSMGVMALVRNLRNFDQVGIKGPAIRTVLDRITDPDEVARARLFPYQVWAAYAHAPSDRWKQALATTLDLTTLNVPALDRTLVVIDASGSMSMPVSGRSRMRRVDVATLMAMVTVNKAGLDGTVDIALFGRHNRAVRLPRGTSALGGVTAISKLVGSVGHSTFGHTAIRDHFDPARHDRVVLFTDDQQHDSGTVDLGHVPRIYTFDLAGHRPRSMPFGSRGRYALAGFSDATFSLMATLDAGQDADWPF